MSLTDTLNRTVGAAHVITDPDVLDGRSVDHTGRYRGKASALAPPMAAKPIRKSRLRMSISGSVQCQRCAGSWQAHGPLTSGT